jgi:hypothetical protein
VIKCKKNKKFCLMDSVLAKNIPKIKRQVNGIRCVVVFLVAQIHEPNS